MEVESLGLISSVADIAAIAAGVLGAIMIILGTLIATGRFVQGLFQKHHPDVNIAKARLDPIRFEFGQYINFGLEFFIAKDVLETMFLPSWTEIGQLFALVVIRTVISYFLIYEIHKIELPKKGSH
ncbi:MAG: DUF1622 domain-containing protein [Candidatus Kerfeldbacteria bacterium]